VSGVLQKCGNFFQGHGYGADLTRNKRITWNEGSGKTEGQARRVSRAISSVLGTTSVPGGPPEHAPEPSEPGLAGTRVGGMQPTLPSPAETNGTAGKKQKDERSERHPECRRGVGGKIRVVQGFNFVFDERVQGDIYRERDEGEEGGKERNKRREEGDRNVSGEGEEESNE